MKLKLSPSTKLITNFFSGARSSVPATCDFEEQGISTHCSVDSEQTSEASVTPLPSTTLVVPDDVLHAEVL